MLGAALSTWCRQASQAPADFCAWAQGLGAQGIALDATLDEAYLAALMSELLRLRDRLPTVAIEAPCPRPQSGRSPALATLDKDERRAALVASRAALRTARELGVPVLVVRLGALALRQPWSHTVLAFARGALSETELERLQAQRVARTAQALDLARYALDPLLAAAANAGVTVGLANRARWFEIPDDAEVGVLLEDFRGAPLQPFYDAAAAHARAALGLHSPTPFLSTYGKRAVGVWLTDAAGLRGGLPWGYGDVDRSAVLGALQGDVLRVVHAAPSARENEIARALAE